MQKYFIKIMLTIFCFQRGGRKRKEVFQDETQTALSDSMIGGIVKPKV